MLTTKTGVPMKPVSLRRPILWSYLPTSLNTSSRYFTLGSVTVAELRGVIGLNNGTIAITKIQFSTVRGRNLSYIALLRPRVT